MKQTIYCDCLFCAHYEGGRCLSPILHHNDNGKCQEYILSMEKLDAHLEAQAANPNKPTNYPPQKNLF